MLEACPDALMLIGDGDSAALHNASYDFDDRVLLYGIGFWLNLARLALAN